MPDDGQLCQVYDDTLVARLELLWGEGFLSPGGPAEVRELLYGISLLGQEVLDIGCGLGGVDVLLAREHGARHVVGVDVEPALLARAERRARASDVAERLRFQRVDPGPLPFANGSFDLVFSKDSIISIPDRDVLYSEIFRVLRPGGQLVVGDWFRGEDRSHPAHVRLQVAAPITVAMDTLESSGELLARTGFRRVRVRDRNEWYAEEAHRELEALVGPLKKSAMEAIGEQQYRQWIELRGVICDALDAGCLRPGHLFGSKPKEDG